MAKIHGSEEMPDGLNERVIEAAQAALHAQSTVSAFDVLVHMGWLYPGHVNLWLRRHEAYPHIEAWMQSRRPRRVHVIRHLEARAQAAGLVPVPQRYLPKTLRATDQELQITPDGDPALEALYRTAFASPNTPAPAAAAALAGLPRPRPSRQTPSGWQSTPTSGTSIRPTTNCWPRDATGPAPGARSAPRSRPWPPDGPARPDGTRRVR